MVPQTNKTADKKLLEIIEIPKVMRKVWFKRLGWNFFYTALFFAIWGAGLWFNLSTLIVGFFSTCALLVLFSWPCHLGRVAVCRDNRIKRRARYVFALVAILFASGSVLVHLALSHWAKSSSWVLAAYISFGLALWVIAGIFTRRNRSSVWRRLTQTNYWATQPDDVLIWGVSDIPEKSVTTIFREFYAYFDMVNMDDDPVVLVETNAFMNGANAFMNGADDELLGSLKVAAQHSRALILVCAADGLGSARHLLTDPESSTHCVVLLMPDDNPEERLVKVLNQLGFYPNENEIAELAKVAAGLAMVDGRLQVYVKSRVGRTTDLAPSVMLTWELETHQATAID